jgi:hypothetical protein
VFTGGLLSQMLYGIGFNGMMFYSQPFLQRFLGFSPSEAGLVMLPPALAIIVLTPMAFLMSAKIGPRPAIGAGMALMGLGMVLFSMLKVGDGYADLMPGVMLVGVGAALGMPLVMYVLKAVPEKRAGVASGVINVIREASGAFGIAIVGLLVHHVPDEGASAAELETFRAGTSSGLILGAVLVLIGGLISGITLPSRRGWLGPKHGKTSPVIPDVPDVPGVAGVPEFDPTMTPRDPIPALVASASGLLAAPVSMAAAAPRDVPLPRPATWEDDPMPDEPVPTPTPGPHWWTDDDTVKPPDDTYSWQDADGRGQDDERSGPPTPWPAPPSAPPPAPPSAPPPAPPSVPPPAPESTPPSAPPPAPPSAPPPAPPSAPPPAPPSAPLSPPSPAPASPPVPPVAPASPVRANAWEDWPTPESARPTTPIPAVPQTPDADERGPEVASVPPGEVDGKAAVLRASWNPAEAERGDEAAGAGEREPQPLGDDEERPAPPHGWYEPYVPEEGPAEEPQAGPRSDAW